MLTGDKLETAENIGYSCKLLKKEMHMIKCSTLGDIRKQFNPRKALENEEMLKK